MMDCLAFLPAQPEDIETIFAQSKALIERYEDITAIDYSRVLQWMRKKIETNIGLYTRVVCDNNTVAYYCLCEDADRMELDDLYVLPAYRGKGIGSRILEKCLSETNKEIYLYVFSQNTGAISLYKRFGFAISEQVSATRLIMTYRA